MKKYSIHVMAAAFLITFACTKKENDTTAPVITIASPTENQTFNAGDSVTVTFTVNDADMHAYSFSIIKTATSGSIANSAIDTHSNASVNEQFKLVDATTQYKLVVNAEDHAGNTSTKSVNFHTM